MTDNLSVRRNLLYLVLTATVPFVLAINVAAILLGLNIWDDSVASIEKRTITLQTAIETSLREAIVTYLRAKTESAVSVARLIDTDTGVTDLERSFDMIRDYFLAMNVADNGYVYAIDESGRVVIHPDPKTEGRVIPTVEPVKSQLQQRDGYLEYLWRNSFEPLLLPKALYMETYTRRGWIVAATAYRKEFVDLVDVDRLAVLVATFTEGPGSYSIIVDRAGHFVVHPQHTGENLTDFFDTQEAERIKDTFFTRQAGTLHYQWPDSERGVLRPKLLVYRYLPDFDWVIATTFDVQTIRRPILWFVLGALLLSSVLLYVVVRLSLRLARSVSEPITNLATAVESGTGVLVPTPGPRTPRELIVLTERIAAFVDRIGEQQAFLQKSVNEKTVLIREIHHRVKNNLQVIASLLNLQSADVQHPDDAVLFDRSRDRVVSIAMVHEQLYQTDDLSMIPFDMYLEDLVGHIRNAHHLGAVTVTLDIEPISVGIELAVPCGLIINELATNALKHAFPIGGSGEIEVLFRYEVGRYLLCVSDTGTGIARGAPDSLGMTLVKTLVEQIGATMEITGNNGTSIKIYIPKSA